MKRLAPLDLSKAVNVTLPRFTNLAGFPTASSFPGTVAYANDTNKLYFSNGTTWIDVSPLTSAMQFKGVVAFGAAEPGSPATGDTYIFSTAGNNAWEGTVAVEAGDMAIWDGTVWRFIQTNLNLAAGTESTAGILQLASVVEAIAGSNTTKAVTPAGVLGAIQANRCTSVDGTAGAVLTGNSVKVSFPVIHTAGANAIIEVRETVSGELVSLDLTKVDTTTTNIVFAIAPPASPTYTVTVR
ncbi:MAG: hypothetical protein ABI002_05915 [Saprospiraceae bacterium]